MGYCFSYFDLGVFFTLLALWWMFKTYTDYIKCMVEGRPFISKISFDTDVCGRGVPIERLLKTIFPIMGLVHELITTDGSFVDGDGRFDNTVELVRISIYGLFILHGIVDLLTSYRICLHEELQYITASLAFLWFGTAFYFLSIASTEKSVLGVFVYYRLPLLPIIMSGVAFWFDRVQRNFLSQVLRIFFVLCLGTWMIHVPFIHFGPLPNEGVATNTTLDDTDEKNTLFVVACFGFHMLANSVIMTLGYVISCHDVIKQRNRRTGTNILKSTRLDISDVTEYEQLLNKDDDDNIIQI